MPKIVVTDRDGNQHEVEGRAGLKVMETLRELDYGVLAICGGLCSCATCHVLVARQTGSRNCQSSRATRKELLVELSHYDAGRSRLSCQLEFTEQLDGLEVTIAPDE